MFLILMSVSAMVIIPTIIAMIVAPMPVAFGSVSPFFVRLVLIVPMVPVPLVTAVPDKLLARRLSPEMIVGPAVLVKMQVGLRLVHHLFMAMIQIKITVAGGQFMGKCPVSPVQVNELMIRNVIIGLDVGNIIIFHVIVSRGSPGWLYANVDRKMDLGLCAVQQS
jgi:hypothetical protein